MDFGIGIGSSKCRLFGCCGIQNWKPSSMPTGYSSHTHPLSSIPSSTPLYSLAFTFPRPRFSLTLASSADGPASHAALPIPSQAGRAALPSLSRRVGELRRPPLFRRRAGEPRRSPLHLPAGCAGLPYLTPLVGCATVPSLRRRASLRRPCAPWAADLDDSAARLPFAAELGPSPLSMGAGGAPTVKELHGRAELWTGERG